MISPATVWRLPSGWWGAVILGTWLTPATALAYIGPGAGFAFAGSLFVLLATFFLAVGILLTWPFMYLLRRLRFGNPYRHSRCQRVVVLGLDGMDPGLTTRFMQQGDLPNLKGLAEVGVFRPLDTSNPSMSPVAWSTFATGVDPSRHNIFDFLTRDPCTNMPMLSSTEIRQASKVLNIGRYVVPLGQPRIKLRQKSEWFWKYLGERRIRSIIQRVPITFPPKPFHGLLLSGMCVPDLRGSQGTFSFYTTRQRTEAEMTGGEQTRLRRPARGGAMRSRIVGPDNTLLKSGGRMTLPFSLEQQGETAVLTIDGESPLLLKAREYSPWVTLTFKPMPGVTVSGIVRFYLTECGDELSLYMTPIHIDPENPAMPISHPSVYAVYLAKKQGKFGTLGLAEDTWALNERVIDEQAFLDQAMLLYGERKTMFFDALDHTRKGLVTTVFDTTDRVQHMFYRYLDPTHPANVGKDTEKFKDTVRQVYVETDRLIGETLARTANTDTTLMVISDHGFTNFRRGVNLNAWLRDQGYLVLKEGRTSLDWFENVDWKQTQAFALGLTGIFINRKGRERSGVVNEGREYQSLVANIAQALETLDDPVTGKPAVRRVTRTHAAFEGPYRVNAPDLLVGYEGGYRNSWECATGAVTEEVFCDNTKSWSGDHCVDPAIVPGIFFCNRRINTETPRLIDVPYAVMKLFGQRPPRYMQGRDLFSDEADVGGMLDPRSLEQSGAAPGARVHDVDERDPEPQPAPGVSRSMFSETVR